MKRAIVTGGTSFIGSVLTRRLLESGYSVYAIVRPESANRHVLPRHPELKVMEMDVSETSRLIESGINGDLFFHLAWSGVGSKGRSDPQIQARNIENSIACLRTAAAIGCSRFVFAGSQAEYGICRARLTEQCECHPKSEYGKAKLQFLQQATQISTDIGIDYCHARIFSVYGPGDHPWTLVSTCIDQLLRSEPVELGSCTQNWNYLHVDDAATAMIALAERNGTPTGQRVFNIASHDTRPLKEFVREIHHLTGQRGDLRFGERMEDTSGIVWLDPDIARLVQATGWQPTITFERGILGMIGSDR